MRAMPQDQKSPADSPRVYRAASAPWLTGFLVILGVAVAVAGWGHNPLLFAASVCCGAAVAGLGYALYWRPRLEVHADELARHERARDPSDEVPGRRASRSPW